MADLSNEWFEKYLSGVNFDLPDTGIKAPEQEASTDAPVASSEDKVFLQKIITEIFVYTDIDGKTFGTTSIQDIVVMGEMSREEAMKIVDTRKGRKKRKSD